VSCCNDLRESRIVAPSPRVQTERPQLAPCLTALALLAPDAGLDAMARSLARGFPASTAGPPPVPLRI
jgi:uncharacterized membrane protein YidH (DUF202 family)